MMTDPISIALIGTSVLASLGLVSYAGLKAFGQWISLKQQQMARAGHAEPDYPQAGGLVEMADLKERIRKLEAIAAGIDL